MNANGIALAVVLGAAFLAVIFLASLAALNRRQGR